jgi:hypothetical protein
MICSFCKFDNGDAAVFCAGCGGDLTRKPKRSRKASDGARGLGRIMLWIAGTLGLTAILCLGVLVLALRREAEPIPEDQSVAPSHSADQAAPPRIEAQQRPMPPPVDRRAASRSPRFQGHELQSATLKQWQLAARSTRLTFAANYITARVNVASIEEIKNATVWLERCISNAAESDIAPRTTAVAASSCFARIKWQK